MTAPAERLADPRGEQVHAGAHPGSVVARDFSFWYGAKRALEGVDLVIPPRAVAALIGPSGCGKSTFLRSINRMNELIPGVRHEGRVELDGENVYDPGV